MTRFWPGFLAVWAAIILHTTWVVLLLWPGSHAGSSTPVHELVLACGGRFQAAGTLAVVASIASTGTLRHYAAGLKIFFLLPQQLMLGISAAGAVLAVYHSQYADGVPRPVTFIAADQLAVVLTWAAHTCAIIFLYFIHEHQLTLGGQTRSTLWGSEHDA